MGNSRFQQKNEHRRRRAGGPIVGTVSSLVAQRASGPIDGAVLRLFKRRSSDPIYGTAIRLVERSARGSLTKDTVSLLVGRIPVTCKLVKMPTSTHWCESQGVRGLEDSELS